MFSPIRKLQISFEKLCIIVCDRLSIICQKGYVVTNSYLVTCLIATLYTLFKQRFDFMFDTFILCQFYCHILSSFCSRLYLTDLKVGTLSIYPSLPVQSRKTLLRLEVFWISWFALFPLSAVTCSCVFKRVLMLWTFFWWRPQSHKFTLRAFWWMRRVNNVCASK